MLDATATARRLPRLALRAVTVLSCALTALAVTATAASASVGATRYAEGLHLSTGALVDPAGRAWVADHNAGFCRVSSPTDAGPGTIEHPRTPGAAGPKTCLGGLLPDAAPGPNAAGQPVFVDPTPDWPSSGDEVALIPDGASPSSQLVRARWNPFSQRFTYLDTITMQGARGRPTTLSVGPDDAVYVGFQRETTIQRVRDAWAPAPIVETVGRTADGKGPLAVGAGRDAAGDLRVYVAESTGLRVLDPSPAAPTTTASPVDLGATTVGAMFYDDQADALYVGTADGAGEVPGAQRAEIDRLIRIDARTGAVDDAYATGFSMVGGIGEAAGGNLFVADDPALLDPAEPIGTGRLWHVGLPVAHVTAGPLDDAGATGRDHHTADSTPTFQVAGDGTVQCKLSGPGVTTGWVDCSGGTFEVTTALADATYALAVRAAQGASQGLPEALRFTVDTVAPQRPVITKPSDDATVSSAPWFEFGSEPGVAYSCVFDGAEDAVPCTPGRTSSYSNAGEHTLRIYASDRAGNRSDASAVKHFTVDPDLPPAPAPGWGAGPPDFKGSSLMTAGLHVPSGAIYDPSGRLWVSDHNGGFCRTTEPGEDGAGRLDHPALPGDPGPRTCLGGLLPEAGRGPDAAGQPAFVDPTPDLPGNGDEVVLVPDGASPSSAVHRMRWNPAAGLFEPLDTVSMIGARVRPTAAATGPDGAVYVIFQKSGTVQRIDDPAGDAPKVDVVGNTATGRADAFAAGEDAEGHTTLYIAEPGGITALRPNAGPVPTAQPAGIDLGVDPAIGAMTFDLRRGQLYLGSALGTVVGADTVHRVTIATGDVERDWVTGYSMIGGLAVRPDGVVLVLDDPALLDPAQPLGLGRLFHVGLPAAHVRADRTRFDTSVPQLTISGDAAISCRLRGPNGLDTGYQACAAGPWTPATALADGDYVLSVRSAAGAQVGLVEVQRFAVDTVAPDRPVIVSPESDAITGASPWFEFQAEDGAAFECRWDDAPGFVACEPGFTRTFAANGRHTLTIRAVDQAGNVSQASVPMTFDVRGRVTAVSITSAPAAVSTNPAPRFTFTADAINVRFACRLDTAAFTTCTSPKVYEGVADGLHTFEVKAIDAQGDVSPVAARSFRVDRVAPTVTIAGVAEGEVTGPDVTFRLAADEQATLRCRLDAAAFALCTSPVTLTGLADGAHRFEVTATDAAGNVSLVAARAFTVTTVAPDPQPVQPAVQVIDQTTGQPLSIRIAAIDRRVDLARIQAVGVQVSVIPAQGTKLIRFRIFKVGGGRGRAVAAAARTRGTVVATIYRKVRPGRRTVTLTRREMRRVGVGRYVLEATAGRSRTRLGATRRATFTVTP